MSLQPQTRWKKLSEVQRAKIKQELTSGGAKLVTRDGGGQFWIMPNQRPMPAGGLPAALAELKKQLDNPALPPYKPRQKESVEISADLSEKGWFLSKRMRKGAPPGP